MKNYYFPALADCFDNCSTKNLEQALKEATELFIALKAYGTEKVEICGKTFSALDPNFKAFCCFAAMFATRTPSDDSRFLAYFKISKYELDMRLSSIFPNIYRVKGDFLAGVSFMEFIEDFRNVKPSKSKQQSL